MKSKALAVSLLLLFATLLFTGCRTNSKSLGKNLQVTQRVGLDFLTTPKDDIREDFLCTVGYLPEKGDLPEYNQKDLLEVEEVEFFMQIKKSIVHTILKLLIFSVILVVVEFCTDYITENHCNKNLSQSYRR